MKGFEWFQKAVSGATRSASQAQIVLLPDGFQAGESTIKWEAVTEVSAFKQDSITVDDVWFQIRATDVVVLVSEDQPAFAEFESALVGFFPSVSDWRDAVMLPPFERNFTVLWRRP